MKYCRFLFEGPDSVWRGGGRGGELWIVDLAEAPEEDLAYQLGMHAHGGEVELVHRSSGIRLRTACR